MEEENKPNQALNNWLEINHILKQHGYEYVEVKDELGSKYLGTDKYHWTYRKVREVKCCCGFSK